MVLYNFIDEIVFRANHDKYLFEHLKASRSKIHKGYKPFNEKTVVMLDKVIKEVGHCKEHLNSVARIFATS